MDDFERQVEPAANDDPDDEKRSYTRPESQVEVPGF